MIATGRMRNVSKIFIHLGFFDSHTFVRKVNSVCFGGDIWARQLERSIGGLQGQGYKYPEAVEIFSC